MTFTRDHLQRLAQGRILVVGDVMLDHFIWGHVRRISPEAPVPIVEVTREEFYPGGAANVARNISPFSPHTHLMGRVGRDMAADRLRALLIEDKVDPAPLLVHETLPTISKARVSARQQQIVRVDREKLLPLTDTELIEVEQRLRDLAPSLDAIILEDYGKGFMTEKLMRVVAKVAAEHKLIVTVDPSPRNPLPWAGVSLVKPNRLEAFAAAGLEDHLLPEAPLENKELLEVGRVLLAKWDVASILVTLGEQGMILFERDLPPHHIPTRAREVFDVSGAGDTAIALLTLALASGHSLLEAAEISNHASGIVVGKLGTATLTPDELLAAFESK
ncbi:bifunctional heptose 7-phosphate kinase/heptose 1-phosphate adenyltransferase [Prosthecobacter sp.]|uniref:bifunctional heptose 7-phosphate kinase/heptose 1-phosphate adenyltransferase n=1 Tax=Prosthecobacter sp. TaxID=1965333 RepID=UPI003784CEFB